jgi:hypothetical protein
LDGYFSVESRIGYTKPIGLPEQQNPMIVINRLAARGEGGGEEKDKLICIYHAIDLC